MVGVTDRATVTLKLTGFHGVQNFRMTAVFYRNKMLLKVNLGT